MNTLREYIVKGFVLNDELLKNGPQFGKDYFDELFMNRSAGASSRGGNLARNGGGESAWGIREIPGETGRGICLGLRQGIGAIPERERRIMNQRLRAIAGRAGLRPTQLQSLEILERITEIVPPGMMPELAEVLAIIKFDFPTSRILSANFPQFALPWRQALARRGSWAQGNKDAISMPGQPAGKY
jgi:hypothetical protein